MKTKIILSLLVSILFAGFGYAQKLEAKDVPSKISEKFTSENPKATDVEWNKDGELFKVEFEIGDGDKDHHIWYNASGNKVKHKEEIAKADLPQRIQVKLDGEYTNFKVDDIYKITEGNKISYKVELKEGKNEKKIVFDADANVLKTHYDSK